MAGGPSRALFPAFPPRFIFPFSIAAGIENTSVREWWKWHFQLVLVRADPEANLSDAPGRTAPFAGFCTAVRVFRQFVDQKLLKCVFFVSKSP